MLRRAIPWLLLLVALGALGGFAAFLLGEGTATTASREALSLSGHQAELVGAPRAETLEALLQTLPAGADADTQARFAERLREHAARNPSLLEKLAAWLRLSPEALAALGIDHLRVVQALAALGDDGARVLGEAYAEEPSPLAFFVPSLIFRELLGMGAHAASATPALLALAAATDAQASRRWEAIRILRQIGPAAKEALPLLHTLVRPPVEGGLGGEAAAALVAIAGPTPEVVESFRLAIADGTSTELTAIVGAAPALGKAGAPLASLLLPYLEDHEPRMRMAAAAALGAFGDASPQVVGALARLLQDERGSGAGDALAALGGPGRAALAELAAEGRPYGDRLAALQALAGVGVDLRAYVPALLRLAGTDDARVQPGALALLSGLDPPAEGDAVMAWCQAHVDDPDPSVAQAACRTLARMPGGEGVAFLLTWARESRQTDRRRQAAAALRDVRPDDARQLATEALDLAGDWPSTRAALWLFPQLSARPEPGLALARIEKHLGDEDPKVRQEAVAALGAIQADDERILPWLLEALADDATRNTACFALEQRPRTASAAVPALLDTWLGLTGWQGTRVWYALRSLGPRWSGTAAAIDAAAAKASVAQKQALEQSRATFVGTK